MDDPANRSLDREATGLDSTRELDQTRVAGGQDERPSQRGDEPLMAAPGERIGRYFVLDTLGKGAMGVVVRAFDPELERTVALKVVNPRLLDRGRGDEARARLVAEARAQARLSHPNVTAIYDVGVHEHHVYLAMELVEGSDMATWLREQTRPWSEIVEAFRAAAEGLSAAHAAGLVHRDVKPANILVGRDGRVRLSDFGIARADAESITPAQSESDLGPTDQGITKVGYVVGTPAYMAPEQHLGASIGPPADQYALCVALYEALYGERPFEGTMRELVRVKTEGRLREPDRPEVPRWLWPIVLRGLHPSAEQRYASLADLAAALGDDPARRRRRWLGLLPGLAAAGLATAAVLMASSEPAPCEGVGVRMEQVWNDATRDEIRARFEASGRPYARAAFERTGALIDERAEAWVSMRRDACRATRVRHEQSEALLDRRMLCLDHRLDELGALIDELKAADGLVVDRSVDAIADLRGLDRCANRTILQAAVAPPETEAERAEAEAIRTALAAARAHRGAGHFDQGLQTIETTRPRSEALGYAPVQAEVQLLHASMLEELGRTPEALTHAKQALWTAQAAGHDEVVAEAATLLAWLTAERQGEPEVGLDWVRHGEATVARMGGDDDLRGQLLIYEGVARVNAAQYDLGAEAYERALTHYREHFGEDHPRIPRIMGNMANLTLRRGNHADALASYQGVLERTEALHGPEHPRTARIHDLIGTTLLGLGRLDDAIEEYEHTLEVLVRSLGPEHPEVALTKVNLAHAYAQAGRPDTAGRLYEEALHLLEGHPDHPQLPNVLNNLGHHYANADEPERALPYIRRALTLFETRLGPDHPNLIYPLLGLGRIHAALGQTSLALEALDRQHGLAVATYGDHHRLVAVAHAEMGNALLGAGRQAEALDRFRAALSAFERNPDATPTDRSIALNDVASTLLLMERMDEAMPLLEQALEAGEHPGVVPLATMGARLNLARGLVAAGEQPQRARQLAEQALAIAEGLGPGAQSTAAEIRAWMESLPEHDTR